MTHYDDAKETFRCEHGKVRGVTGARRCQICEPTSRDHERLTPVDAAVRRIRFWLVQSFRYTASTIELDEVLTREIARAALRQERRFEVCICAAIQLANGELFRGHRHDDAIQTAGKAGVPREAIFEAEQGFMTSRNRFVSRDEGTRLQVAAGIRSATTGELPTGMLFSEDLYLRSTKGQSLEPARASDARPTDLAEGTAIGSADHSSSPSFVVREEAEPTRDERIASSKVATPGSQGEGCYQRPCASAGRGSESEMIGPINAYTPILWVAMNNDQQWEEYLRARRAAYAAESQLTALTAERDAHKRDFEAELDGNAAIRRRYGARDDESFIAFIERLYLEASQLSALRQENGRLLRELGKPATSTDGNSHSPTTKG